MIKLEEITREDEQGKIRAINWANFEALRAKNPALYNTIIDDLVNDGILREIPLPNGIAYITDTLGTIYNINEGPFKEQYLQYLGTQKPKNPSSPQRMGI